MRRAALSQTWNEAERKVNTPTVAPSTVPAPGDAKAGAPSTAPDPVTEMRKAASVQVSRKVFLAQNVDPNDGEIRFLPEVDFTVQMTNTGRKDIRAVRGVITFTTLFGDPVKKARWTYDAGLKAGRLTSEQVTLTVNPQFDSDDNKLATTALSNLKVRWDPEGIIFSDGTTLGEVNQK